MVTLFVQHEVDPVGQVGQVPPTSLLHTLQVQIQVPVAQAVEVQSAPPMLQVQDVI